jgi:hypothetical protein
MGRLQRRLNCVKARAYLPQMLLVCMVSNLNLSKRYTVLGSKLALI